LPILVHQINILDHTCQYFIELLRTLPPFIQDSPEVRLGAGNIYCSAEALIQFEQALSGHFLTQPSRELLYSSRMGFDGGKFEDCMQGIEVRGKSGVMGGPVPPLSTVLYSIPQKNTAIVVLSNKQLVNAHWAPDLGEKLLPLALKDIS
jgi:hypothetical protein